MNQYQIQYSLYTRPYSPDFVEPSVVTTSIYNADSYEIEKNDLGQIKVLFKVNGNVTETFETDIFDKNFKVIELGKIENKKTYLEQIKDLNLTHWIISLLVIFGIIFLTYNPKYYEKREKQLKKEAKCSDVYLKSKFETFAKSIYKSHVVFTFKDFKTDYSQDTCAVVLIFETYDDTQNKRYENVITGCLIDDSLKNIIHVVSQNGKEIYYKQYNK